jgi:2-(1,2-epoxy-1,2-dihydrophenyl)acetyl-CoA isomerase
MYEPFLSLLDIAVPVVGAINGHAVGGGFGLALVCDLRIGARDAKYGANFARIGLAPGMAVSYLLPRLVGVARAKELLLLGRKVTGREAAEWGLIHRAVADADLDAATGDVVAQLCAAPTVALGLTKRCIQRGLEGSLADAMEAEANALELSSRSPDFKEGLAAFREKRPPRFEGR